MVNHGLYFKNTAKNVVEAHLLEFPHGGKKFIFFTL